MPSQNQLVPGSLAKRILAVQPRLQVRLKRLRRERNLPIKRLAASRPKERVAITQQQDPKQHLGQQKLKKEQIGPVLLRKELRPKPNQLKANS